ncbi:hypothetical protein pdam_00014639 [Pocillopora damicornis]|uniref:Uncharacterized protein n=1 Tax=Pocillopora damicornis TaxID=46731 RepID=A0A3M6TM49_POCDA|nr:hypothetical protein pdam_00014639 [Pocillopora damicornis]
MSAIDEQSTRDLFDEKLPKLQNNAPDCQLSDPVEDVRCFGDCETRSPYPVPRKFPDPDFRITSFGCEPKSVISVADPSVLSQPSISAGCEENSPPSVPAPDQTPCESIEATADQCNTTSDEPRSRVLTIAAQLNEKDSGLLVDTRANMSAIGEQSIRDLFDGKLPSLQKTPQLPVIRSSRCFEDSDNLSPYPVPRRFPDTEFKMFDMQEQINKLGMKLDGIVRNIQPKQEVSFKWRKYSFKTKPTPLCYHNPAFLSEMRKIRHPVSRLLTKPHVNRLRLPLTNVTSRSMSSDHASGHCPTPEQTCLPLVNSPSETYLTENYPGNRKPLLTTSHQTQYRTLDALWTVTISALILFLTNSQTQTSWIFAMQEQINKLGMKLDAIAKSIRPKQEAKIYGDVPSSEVQTGKDNLQRRRITLPLYLKESKFPCEFQVVQNLTYDAILGRDFLQVNRAMIDLDNNTITLNESANQQEQACSASAPLTGTFKPQERNVKGNEHVFTSEGSVKSSAAKIEWNLTKDLITALLQLRQNVFNIKPLLDIIPSTMGFVVTLPAIVLPTIEQDDHKLDNRFSFSNLL